VFAASAVAVLPALSDSPANTAATQAGGPQAAAGAFSAILWLAQQPIPASPPATAAPTVAPTPTATPSPAPTAKPKAKPKPKPKPIVYPDTVAGAKASLKARIGLHQFDCIDYIFARESKWNPRAGTPSGAYGIPQAFPGTKMAKFGSNWLTSPLTQVKWGVWYVDTRYSSACAALAFWKAHGWY
jgi:hypothetical protein